MSIDTKLDMRCPESIMPVGVHELGDAYGQRHILRLWDPEARKPVLTGVYVGAINDKHRFKHVDVEGNTYRATKRYSSVPGGELYIIEELGTVDND